jgi:hypothetical protein
MEAFYDFCTDGGLLDVLAELLYDVVADVGLEEGLADVAHGVGDVGLGDSSSARQGAEDGVKFFG